MRDADELARVVEMIRQALAPHGVAVTAPVSLPGKVSRVARRFDMLLESGGPLTPVRALIEYKGGGAPGDVRWVDTVAARSADVGVFRVLLIAAKGFTPAAKRLASNSRIELMSLEQIASHALLDWYKGRTAGRVSPFVRLGGVVLGLPFAPEDIPDDALRTLQAVPPSGPLFRQRKDGREFSLLDLWRLVDTDALLAGVPVDGGHQPKSVRITLDDSVDLVVAGNALQVEYIILHVDIWRERSENLLAASFSYSDGQRELAAQAETPLRVKRATYALELCEVARPRNETTS